MKKSLWILLTAIMICLGMAGCQSGEYSENTVLLTAETVDYSVEETIEMSIEDSDALEFEIVATVEPTAEPTLEHTAEPTAEPTPEPTMEPTAEPTAEPTPEPTPEPTLAPTPEPRQESAQTTSGTCWKSATGEKYHSINNCGRMNPQKATQITVEQAIKMGLEACQKCWY